jgi:flagellin
MVTIASNGAANTSVRYLNNNSDDQSSLLAKLSSGRRIERASDDAAGLGISNRLDASVTTLEQASINASNAMSVLQTADGALASVSDILQRMKSLATQGQSGILDTDDYAAIDAEFQQLVLELDAIATNTNFNGVALLDGTYDQDFMVGTDTTDVINVLIDNGTAGSGFSSADLAVPNTAITDGTVAATAADAIDAAISLVSSSRATVGAAISRFEFRSDVLATSIENLSAASSTIKDADIASVQTAYTNAETLTEAAIAALSKANEMPQELLRLLQG